MTAKHDVLRKALLLSPCLLIYERALQIYLGYLGQKN